MEVDVVLFFWSGSASSTRRDQKRLCDGRKGDGSEQEVDERDECEVDDRGEAGVKAPASGDL